VAAISSQIKNQIKSASTEPKVAAMNAGQPVDFAGSGQSAARQQPGSGRQRHAQLFDEYCRKQDRCTVRTKNSRISFMDRDL